MTLPGEVQGAEEVAGAPAALDEVVLGAGPQGLDGEGPIGARSVHDDGRARRVIDQSPDRVHAFAVRQGQVEEDDAVRIELQAQQRFGEQGHPLQAQGLGAPGLVQGGREPGRLFVVLLPPSPLFFASLSPQKS